MAYDKRVNCHATCAKRDGRDFVGVRETLGRRRQKQPNEGGERWEVNNLHYFR